VRRKFQRGLKRKPLALIKRLRKAKKEAPALEKPEVRTTFLASDVHINLKYYILKVFNLFNQCPFRKI